MTRSIVLVRLSYLFLLLVSPAVPFATLQCGIISDATRIRKRARRLWQASLHGVVVRATFDPYHDDDNDNDDAMPPTVIGNGSKIRAETFTCTNSVIVEGELDVKRLECGQRAGIHVTSTGRIKGQIYGGILVTVDGKLEGSVVCFELVVGPGGVVTGDVNCKDV
jgi:Polymer-forming cytoskeletal